MSSAMTSKRIATTRLWATSSTWGPLVTVLIVSQQDQRRPADAIVVLGAAQYNGRPSPVFRARLDHALQLYREGLAPRIMVTVPA